ncbi:MAG: ATP-binding protein [Rhodobacteraceae bacterium]|nr:ATP-binding protein [Paracoccaceae bacterium]
MIWQKYRPGIRARLWFALALLSFSTLFVGGVGWYTLDRANFRLRELSSSTLSEVTRSLRLSRQSSDLATSAPYLLNLKSSYLIKKEGQRLLEALEPILNEWPGGQSEAEGSVYTFDAEISDAVREMERAISDLMVAAERLGLERDKTSAMQLELTMMEALFFQQLAEGGEEKEQRLWLALQTLTDELAGAGHAENLLGVGERQRRYLQMQQYAGIWYRSLEHKMWAGRLDALASGTEGMFEVRRRELSRQLESQNALFRTSYNASKINDLVARFASNAEAFLSQSRSETATSISFAKVLILVFMVAAILIALVAALFVSGYVTGNIRAISEAMQRLALGDRSSQLEKKMHGDDEIGKLHHAFSVFRENALRLDDSHQQLRQQMALFEEVFANISSGIAITDKSGNLTATNPMFNKVLRPEVLRPEVLQPEEQPEGTLKIEAFLAQTPFAEPSREAGLKAGFQGTVEIASTDDLILEVRCTRLPDGGGIWLFSDVTERRKMESRLQHIEHIESLGQVTGEVAHDFGNVLSTVNANVYLLETGSESVSREVLLQRISNAVDIGISLTQRLLAFARKQALVPEVVEINELIEGMAELISIGLKDGVELEVVPADTSLFVKVDPGQLESAILNLCLNSAQAMHERGLIRLLVEKTGRERVRITVSDNGSGMNKSVLAHALEPFFSAREDGSGTGLGLSMVYGFIKQTGGDIQISSQPSIGTVVQLTLPLSRYENARGLPLNSQALLVEDDPEAMISVAAQLEEIGYRVRRAGGFDEGMAALEEMKTLDMLVTDLHLDDGHAGWDIVDKCLKDRPDTRIVLMSGHMPVRHKYSAAPPPQLICIAKPLTAEKLQPEPG